MKGNPSVSGPGESGFCFQKEDTWVLLPALNTRTISRGATLMAKPGIYVLKPGCQAPLRIPGIRPQ